MKMSRQTHRSDDDVIFFFGPRKLLQIKPDLQELNIVEMARPLVFFWLPQYTKISKSSTVFQNLILCEK